jgi:hypothetical protein
MNVENVVHFRVVAYLNALSAVQVNCVPSGFGTGLIDEGQKLLCGIQKRTIALCSSLDEFCREGCLPALRVFRVASKNQISITPIPESMLHTENQRIIGRCYGR